MWGEIRRVLLIFVIGLSCRTVFALDLPPLGSPTYIQTTGPNAGLNIGDFYTNVGGANTNHLMEIYVPCPYPSTLPITFALYDPESSGPNPAGLSARDEIRGTSDNTTFTLTAPGGNVVGPTVYTPGGGTNGLWVELTTLTTGAAGNGCGTYTLTTSTSDDDDNAWRLRVVNDPDCTISPGTCTGIGAAQSTLLDDGDQIDDPDNAAGTGDEIQTGLTRTSFQHSNGGTICQDFFLFVDGLTSPVTFNNFDIDNNGSITYFPPAGSAYLPSQAGTTSANAVWNNPPGGGSPPPRGGDAFVINATDVGWWRTEVCASNNNQYIFEGIDGEPIFFTQPPFPQMTIAKDNGRTTVSTLGEQVTYTITYANTGNGAALDTIVTDTLPTGSTFVSCSNSCTNAGATVTWDLGVVPAAPNAGNTGTLTLTVDLPPAPDGSTHINTVAVNYTDFAGSNYPPRTDTDVDNVVTPPLIPAMTINKDDGRTTVSTSGEQVTYALAYSNTGNGDATSVVVTDTLPIGATFVSCSNSCTPAGTTVSWNLGTVGPGTNGTLTLTVNLPPSPAQTDFTNTVSLSYTDPANNPYPNATDTDVNTAAPDPPPPSAPAAPVLTIVDPFITKVVDQPFAIPGEIVTWTIIVTNPGTASIPNVTIADTMPSEVEVLDATATSGTVSVNGQQVNLDVGTLNGGDSVTLTIRAQVRDTVVPPYIITNEACVDALNITNICAGANIISAAMLPETGQSPWSVWRLPIFSVTLLIGLFCGVLGYRLCTRRVF